MLLGVLYGIHYSVLLSRQPFTFIVPEVLIRSQRSMENSRLAVLEFMLGYRKTAFSCSF